VADANQFCTGQQIFFLGRKLLRDMDDLNPNFVTTFMGFQEDITMLRYAHFGD